MFVQMLITLVLVWLLAEVLCRVILKTSVAAAVRDLFAVEEAPPSEVTPDAPAPAEPNAALRRVLGERRRKLAATEQRLELAMEAAEVAERLARNEAELTAAEKLLAEAEARRRLESST